MPRSTTDSAPSLDSLGDPELTSRALDSLELWGAGDALLPRGQGGPDMNPPHHHRQPPRHPPATSAREARYQAPRATVDPDTTKTWLRRAMPILRAHRGIFITSLVLSFVGLVLQVQIPDLLNHALDNSIETTPCPCTSTCGGCSASGWRAA